LSDKKPSGPAPGGAGFSDSAPLEAWKIPTRRALKTDRCLQSVSSSMPKTCLLCRIEQLTDILKTAGAGNPAEGLVAEQLCGSDIENRLKNRIYAFILYYIFTFKRMAFSMKFHAKIIIMLYMRGHELQISCRFLM
jgi:hypothetical protein